MFGLFSRKSIPIEKNKNALRYRYLETMMNHDAEKHYKLTFGSNIKDLDVSIDENIFLNSTAYASLQEEYDEIKYLFIKKTFIIKDNFLMSNFVVEPSCCFSWQIANQMKNHLVLFDFDKQLQQSLVISEYEESKAKYDEAFEVLKAAFRIFDEHIDEVDVEKSRAIVERRWADVGANEILFRKLNTIKNQVFKFIKEKNKDD